MPRPPKSLLNTICIYMFPTSGEVVEHVALLQSERRAGEAMVRRCFLKAQALYNLYGLVVHRPLHFISFNSGLGLRV